MLLVYPRYILGCPLDPRSCLSPCLSDREARLVYAADLVLGQNVWDVVWLCVPESFLELLRFVFEVFTQFRICFFRIHPCLSPCLSD